MGLRKVFYTISISLCVLSFISFGVRGFSLGIDFAGGRNYVVAFDHAVKTDEVME
jgi:SecD/SecF fusion protein